MENEKSDLKELTFDDLQSYLSQKYSKRISSSSLFMKLVEEVGEVAEVLNQLEGRKASTKENSLEKELADVIHYTVAIASLNQIDLTKVILEKDKEAAKKYNQTPNLEEYLQSIQ